jgi:hypothetical protein
MTALLEREKIQGREDTITEALPQTSHRPEMTADGRPKAEWVRGRCPECGEELVSNLYFLGDKGYLLVWECWGSLAESAECDYRRVL